MKRVPLILALFTILTASCATIGGHKLRQVYYFGVFDPTEQLPPSVYRIRVRGESDWFSQINYAAGWVPSQFVDSIGTTMQFDRDTGTLDFRDSGGEEYSAKLEVGRRLMLWGPEGFRRAPENYRLAIVMAASPEKFFAAIDDALGQLSAAKALELTSAPEVEAEITDSILEVTRTKAALDAFLHDLPAATE